MTNQLTDENVIERTGFSQIILQPSLPNAVLSASSTNTPCLKNVPTLTYYSLDIHDPIVISFDRSVAEEVRNRMMLRFPTSPL